MSTTYKELLAQRDKLEQEIARVRDEERNAVINDIKQKMADYQIPVTDLAPQRGTKKRGTRQPKYRDPASGATWSGMGREPRWIADQDRAAFAI
jgi:DNA-binding protein H-NS